MDMKMKVFLLILISNVFIAIISAEDRYGNRQSLVNRKSNRDRGNNESAGEGRTLGFVRPVVGLGLSNLARPFTTFGFDAPLVAARPQFDPYYGGYGGYGSFVSGFFPGINYFPPYPQYRPPYGGFNGGYLHSFVGAYGPQLFPTNYGGYGAYNGYGVQLPIYSNQRPIQRPNIGGQSPRPGTSTSGAVGTQINSSQASQIAYFLGQLLGQQLRPLLNQGASTAQDVQSLQGKESKGAFKLS